MRAELRVTQSLTGNLRADSSHRRQGVGDLTNPCRAANEEVSSAVHSNASRNDACGSPRTIISVSPLPAMVFNPATYMVESRSNRGRKPP